LRDGVVGVGVEPSNEEIGNSSNDDTQRDGHGEIFNIRYINSNLRI
jgi:hypothetical protein